MSDVAEIEEKEKVFEYFEVLPPEIRTMLIDEMQADDKCRFVQCSKESNYEAKNSEKFIYSLEFHGYAEDDLQIEVIHAEYKTYQDKRHGFYWQFKEVENRKYMECMDLDEKQLWVHDLDESTDLVDFATKHFKDFLQKHQKTIKKLFINKLFKVLEGRETMFDLELETLSRVRELKFYDSAGFQQIIPKLRRPLKFLEVIGIENSKLLPACEHLYRVSNILYAVECKLNYEQLKDLSADRIEMNMGYLTEENIADLIKLWQNGRFGRKKLAFYRWDLGNSGFSVIKLFSLLKSPFSGNVSKTISFEHLKEEGREAELCFNIMKEVSNKKYLTLKEMEPK